MANIYTKDEEELSSKIFFLNERNIVHELSSDNMVNPIPSLWLLKETELCSKERMNSLCGYINGLSVESRFNELSNQVSSLFIINTNNLKFNGHIRNSARFSTCSRLSDVFVDGQIFDGTTIYNGSFIEIKFESGQISARLKDEPEIFWDGDFLILHDHVRNRPTIEPQDIKYGETAVHLRSGKYGTTGGGGGGGVVYFDLTRENTVNYKTTFNDDVNIKYEYLKDGYSRHLSDVISVQPYLESIYSGIGGIKSECDLSVKFNLADNLSTAFDAIFQISRDPKIQVYDVSIPSNVEDAYINLGMIIRNAKYNGGTARNLKDVLLSFDRRLDNMSESIAALNVRLSAIEDFFEKHQVVVKN